MLVSGVEAMEKERGADKDLIAFSFLVAGS
jgi:hypothetical protein